MKHLLRIPGSRPTSSTVEFRVPDVAWLRGPYELVSLALKVVTDANVADRGIVADFKSRGGVVVARATTGSGAMVASTTYRAVGIPSEGGSLVVDLLEVAKITGMPHWLEPGDTVELELSGAQAGDVISEPIINLVGNEMRGL